MPENLNADGLGFTRTTFGNAGSASNPNAVYPSEVATVDWIYADEGPSAVQTKLDETNAGEVRVWYDKDSSVTWEGSVDVPSGKTLCAWGDWTLVAGSDSNLSTADLHGDTYHYLIANEQSDTSQGTDSRVHIKGFDIDYDSSTKSNTKSHAPLMLSGTEDSWARDCVVRDAVPNVDVPSGWRSFALFQLNTTRTHFYDCEGHDAGYENVSLRGDVLDSTAENCVSSNGGQHGMQIAGFDAQQTTPGLLGTPIGSSIISCSSPNDIMIHGPDDNLAWGCSIEGCQAGDDIRIIGNVWGIDVKDQYQCTTRIYPVSGKNLQHITVDGGVLIDETDNPTAAVRLVNTTTDDGNFRHITIRDIHCKSAYLVEIEEQGNNGEWEEIRIEDNGLFQNGNYSGQSAGVNVTGGPDIGNLYFRNNLFDAQRVMQFDGPIDKVIFEDTNFIEEDRIQELAGGSLPRCELNDCDNFSLSNFESHADLVLEDGIGRRALGGAAPSSGTGRVGDVIEDTENAGDAYQKLPTSGWTQIGT